MHIKMLLKCMKLLCKQTFTLPSNVLVVSSSFQDFATISMCGENKATCSVHIEKVTVPSNREIKISILGECVTCNVWESHVRDRKPQAIGTHYTFSTCRPASTHRGITCACTWRITQCSHVWSFLYCSPTSAPTLRSKKALSDPFCNLLSCFLKKTWNMPPFWWPIMKHDLALAHEVISCRRSKLQNWVDIMTPRFWTEKEIRSTGTLGACKAFQKDLKSPPRRCCLHFYCIERLATCLLHLICKRYSSVSFISQVTKLPKALQVTRAGRSNCMKR